MVVNCSELQMADFFPLVHLQVQFDVQDADQSSAVAGWRIIERTAKKEEERISLELV